MPRLQQRRIWQSLLGESRLLADQSHTSSLARSPAKRPEHPELHLQTDPQPCPPPQGRQCHSARRLCTGKDAAGLTLNIQQRKMVIVGGFRCQCEVETMAALRLVTVHNAYCLDQLRGEERCESVLPPQTPPRVPPAGSAQQSITSFCHSEE